ncbi:MAG: hypothetical protein OWS74_03180 [Firmicutes bacterium]|nr:hypothetical protein [Bacillota bacterium]
MAAVKEYASLWKKSAAVSLGVAAGLAIGGLLIKQHFAWSMLLGLVLGVIDLIGLGMRLPLWVKLGPGPAMVSINVRMLSRLAVLAVVLYVIRLIWAVKLGAFLIGLFFPYIVYLYYAIRQSINKGVDS